MHRICRTIVGLDSLEIISKDDTLTKLYCPMLFQGGRLRFGAASHIDSILSFFLIIAVPLESGVKAQIHIEFNFIFEHAS